MAAGDSWISQKSKRALWAGEPEVWALQFRKQGRNVLVARRRLLLGRRDALHTTLRVFDPELSPSRIEVLQERLRPFGRKASLLAVSNYVRPTLKPEAGSERSALRS